MNSSNKEKSSLVKLFLSASRAHHRVFEGKVKDFGVHRSQHRILMFLSKREGEITSQRDIAEHFEISAPAVAVALGKLEDGGFINRLSNEHDTRSNIITLSQKGQEIVEATKDIIESLDCAMFEGFDDGEIATFESYLSRLLENIKGFED